MKRIKSLKTVKELSEYGFISEETKYTIEKVAEKFNLSVTPAMASLIDHANEQDPIRKQFFPSSEELIESEHELADPIGDYQYETVKGVVHRYPDRCLLKVVNVCPVYCRFCFRKEMIGPGKSSLSQGELVAAYDYIRNQPAIWEVILSGGDPFILKPKAIAAIISSLAEIEHVDVIRIHTRVPVVDPLRISQDLIAALKAPKAVYVVLHANHPNEFTPEAIQACASLVDAGIPMLSQSVLLKGVNDDDKVLMQLMKTFVRYRIKPYYLHHLDMAKGTGHFRLSIKEGQRLMKSLQGQISGLCQPTYMLEIPGGGGKVPIGPCYASKLDGKWSLEDYQGKNHYYEDS